MTIILDGVFFRVEMKKKNPSFSNQRADIVHHCACVGGGVVWRLALFLEKIIWVGRKLK